MPQRLLYMDDDPGSARLFVKHMTRAHYTVDVAHNGEAGLALFDAQPDTYTAVIVDQKMPGMSGLDVIQHLNDRQAACPVLMVTGFGDEKTAVEAMKRGAFDYVVKDASVDYMKFVPTLIREAHKRHQLQRQKEQAEAALRSSEARFRNLVQNITDIIALLNPDGTLQYITPSVQPLMGWVPEHVIGRNIFDFIHPDDRPDALEQFQNTAQTPGHAIPVRHRFRTTDNQWVSLNTVANNLMDEPSVQGIVVVARDDTERVHFENGLIEARRQAEELAQAKSAFLTSISHDLRTPLMSIIGYSEVLSEELSAFHAENARRILRNAQYLQTTLESALDMARLASGQFDVLYTTFDLTKAIEGCLTLLKPSADAKDLPIIFHAPEEPLEGRWSRSAVVRIVNNLLSNAIRFTRKGEITLTLNAEGNHVVLKVADTGCGIEPTFIPKLFKDFQRGATALYPQGSGLGLAIAKRLVDIMNGAIGVESTLGEGSTFTVRLPRLASIPGASEET